MTEASFFDSWSNLLRVVVVGTLAYVALVVLLRASGKRTLSKMNAFDLVVTVALGSTLANSLLSRDVALAEGVIGFAVLIGLQYVITWSSVRWRPVSKLVKSEPALLAYRGEMLPDQLRKNRIVEAEVMAAIREQGLPSLDKAQAVILETDGSFSVVTGSSDEGRLSYRGVQGVPETS